MQADLAVPSETTASPSTEGAEFERIAACADDGRWAVRSDFAADTLPVWHLLGGDHSTGTRKRSNEETLVAVEPSGLPEEDAAARGAEVPGLLGRPALGVPDLRPHRAHGSACDHLNSALVRDLLVGRRS